PNPHPVIQRRQKYQLYNLIAMIALTLINGLQSGVDNAAHIGGAIIGALISIAYILVPHKLRVANLCITVIAASLLTMMIYLYSFSTNKHLLE
ncbi:rhomboid family intramembrane serine protease, partial [Escherichia coli]